MKLGVFDPVFGAANLATALDRAVALGLEAMELGVGGYPGNRRCDPAQLLADPAELGSFGRAFSERELIISALSCHGNPLHPDEAQARRDDEVFRNAVRLAAEVGVERINLFSGCPGDGPDASLPNWVVCQWPDDFAKILTWQWEEKVLPYWAEAGAFARHHGVRLGLEMHPGFVVYNPRTLLRLRNEVGDVIGANFDPSHLFWQGIDPLLAIRELGSAIFHVHAKDTMIDPHNVARNGVLDLVDPADLEQRPWYFRSVGDGHALDFWKQFVAALRLSGYDWVLSIEHEDRLASPQEGLGRAIETLRMAILSQPAATPWW